MSATIDVCIRGAGIVGRTLALLLAGERLRVGLVQSAAPGTSAVMRAALNAASRQLLASLRAWPAAQHATPVQTMQVHGDNGGEVRFTAAEQAWKRWPGSWMYPPWRPAWPKPCATSR